MFILEAITIDGPLCETFDSFDKAQQRLNSLPESYFRTMPLIFQELPDGSQRIIREDRKPLQWHRLPEDRPPEVDNPIPLAEALEPTTEPTTIDEDDELLPLSDSLLGGSIKVVWVKEDAEENRDDAES